MSKNEYSDRARLIAGFPASFRKQVEEVINILPFEHLILLTDGQHHNVDSLVHPEEQTVILNGELLRIPRRIYFIEPDIDKENQLEDVQRTALNCIYLRHHSGFIRQKRLKQLIDQTEYFITPYTFQLLGEYVIEILEDLNQVINDKTIDNYVKFLTENKRYWQQTESRIISYWNVYYRWKYPNLSNYIGKQISDKIKSNAVRFN